jgi:hypothetical protein
VIDEPDVPLDDMAVMMVVCCSLGHGVDCSGYYLVSVVAVVSGHLALQGGWSAAWHQAVTIVCCLKEVDDDYDALRERTPFVFFGWIEEEDGGGGIQR